MIISVLLIAAFLLVLMVGLHLSIQKDLKFTLVIECSTKVIGYILRAEWILMPFFSGQWIQEKWGFKMSYDTWNRLTEGRGDGVTG